MTTYCGLVDSERGCAISSLGEVGKVQRSELSNRGEGTPLHWAVQAFRIDVIRWLVQSGANKTALIKNPSHAKTPHQMTDSIRVWCHEGEEFRSLLL